jgi:2-keto-3-deoxy-L-rhamnonate aldolase RhmA
VTDGDKAVTICLEHGGTLALNQGIMGIQVSEVDNAEEARTIVREAKCPPVGNRSIAGQGMHTGYRSYGARHSSEYAPWANANIIVCPSIESLEGLEIVEARRYSC